MDTPRRKLRNLHLENVQNNSTPIQIPPSPMLKTLGHGTGVSVYRLDRSPKQGQIRSPWAVKRITQRTRATKDTLLNERIIREADILRKLNHPNIVGFRGVVKSPDGVETLALEMCNTSLGSILEERHDEDLGPLPAKNTFKMIMDIAHALDFLHTEARLLHGDLKSFNVLVKGEFEICKLCDFGVSLPLDEHGEINFQKNPGLQYVGTNLWSAPEIIDEVEIIDTKADIFSFGLIIYETLALVPPHTLELDAAFNSSNDVDLESRKQLNYSNCAGSNKSDLDDSLGVHVDERDFAVKSEAEDVVEDEEDEDDTKENDISDFSLTNLEQAYGTRPPLPVAFQLSDDYNCIVELFYLCTNALSEDRPAARTIWQCFENNAANVTASSDAAGE
ncbi:lymphokine-activated killer T-cell-originated protein kinase [Scaptodrosophila lebanonensis]|uniref:Lymphokine-activated killer T-cell-originated protein kinase n=1 Tax=Drosophila lebanonensis TaxID=7225 RepID=A0A6J2TTZ5_DROLE|nr:lymphokine-activated killer T-cell-originated protein kinase [Scaptodrosophila lebanonensis]